MRTRRAIVGGFFYLVSSGVSQTGEQGSELAANGSIGVLPEDDLVELGRGGDLGINSSQPPHSMRKQRSSPSCSHRIRTRVWLLIKRFAVVSTCKGVR